MSIIRVGGKQFALEGKMTNEQVLRYERLGFKSWLYLCSDSFDDYGVENFSTLPTSMKKIHIPINSASPEYAIDSSADEVKIVNYKKFENTLSALPGPILISCRSGLRASAVLAAYKGVIENQTKEQGELFARENGFRYLSSPVMSGWVNFVINHYRNLRQKPA